MARRTVWWKQFVVAAICSALASVLIVAVGPGFSKAPDDSSTSASDQAAENASDNSAAVEAPDAVVSSEADTTAAAETSEVTTSVAAAPGNGNAGGNGNGNANGHSDSGGNGSSSSSSSASAGTSTQASTSSSGNGNGNSHGPGHGNTPAQDCTNPHQGADPNDGGANQNPGPFDNTCHGQISQNGNGPGHQAPGHGTPCAGCVGNADDKNPPGQSLNDHNNGYECDKNHGVGANHGNGNPAHTGCTPPTDCTGDQNPNNNQSCNPPCTVDQNPNVPGVQCDPPLDCTGDTNPHNNKKCEEIICPVGTDKEGKKAPGDDLSKCDNDKVTLCHRTGSESNPFVIITVSDNALPAHLAHGDTVLGTGGSCGSTPTPTPTPSQSTPPPTNPPPTVPPPEVLGNCPLGTDLEGQPMPDGTIRSCNGDDETPVCPEGTDLAGIPMPSGGIEACDEDVLDERITNDPPDAVAPSRERGKLLPFTGTSVLAYLLVGLQLIGAGFLLSRARKKS